MKNCEFCQKEFKTRNRKGRKSSTASFCSRQCYWDSMTILLNCHTCKKDFKRTSNGVLKYCSDPCKKNGEWGSINKTLNIGRPSLKRGKRYPELQGKNSAAWKGGISKVRNLIHATFAYEEWRKACMERDLYTCQKCNDIGVFLEVDHIKPFAIIMNEYNVITVDQALDCVELWDINNGKTLCKPCHRKTDTWGYKTRKLLRKEVE